jgi:fimbrial chaperone protein
MTRTRILLRTIAAIVACGSFTPGTGSISAAFSAPTDTGAGLNISPLRIEIESTQSGATVLVANRATRALPVQTRLFEWTQEGGEDVYAPSTALTISPSIISIPAGETQIVRLIRKGPATAGEKRYRLIVDQLPDPTLAHSGTAEARIRFNVPVFIDRDKAVPESLAWTIGPDGLTAMNSGGATAKIVRIDAKKANGAPIELQRNSLRYVMGGSAIFWPVANACSLGPVTITVQMDGRTVDATPRTTCN